MTAHAILRAKERYGLDLTAADIAAISAACIAGKGMLVRTSLDGRRQYIIRWVGSIVVPIITPGGAIVTFEPTDAFKAGTSRKRGRKRMGKAHRKRPGKGPKSRRKTWGY